MAHKWIYGFAGIFGSVMFLAIAAAVQSTTAPAQAAKEVLRDALDKEPAAPWEWIRHDPTGVRIADGALELKALAGTLWDKNNEARNLLVFPSPLPAASPVIAEVAIRFAPKAQAEQAGLMIYFDDENYVKLVREALDGKRFIVMGVETNGEGKALGKVLEPADTVTLRLTRQDEMVIAHYRVGDDGEWKEVGRGEWRAEGVTMKLGISAYGGPSEEQAQWARFFNFVLWNLPPQ